MNNDKASNILALMPFDEIREFVLDVKNLSYRGHIQYERCEYILSLLPEPSTKAETIDDKIKQLEKLHEQFIADFKAIMEAE